MNWKLTIADAIRNNATVWKLYAVWLAAKSLTQKASENRLLLLAQAYRRWPARWLERRLAPWLTPERAPIWREKRIGWRRYQQQISATTLTKSLLLKAPGSDGEKGVLYVSFEYNWLRLLQHFDVKRLLDEYLFVGASSWSPPDFPVHWALAHLGPDPIFLQISNESDMELYRRFDHHLHPIPLMASDWINPDFYQPKPHPKREIDILMVAGWSHVKRHWLLFRALRQMRRGLRVVLIGQDADGRTGDDVYREATACGVADRIELIRDAGIDEVTRHQCDSRVSIVLSAREGSCVAAAESLFADAPVAMMQDAHVGSRACINPQTGILLRRASLANQLSQFIDESVSYSARDWALANITCHQASAKLNGILRDYCADRRRLWTRDLVPMCWRPDPVYVSREDESSLRGGYEALFLRHGVSVAGHPVSTSLSSTR